MKRTILFFLALSSLGVGFSQEKSKGGFLGNVKDALNKVKTGNSSSLSNDEVIAGLKEALSVGASNSTNKLSAADGLCRDPRCVAAGAVEIGIFRKECEYFYRSAESHN